VETQARRLYNQISGELLKGNEASRLARKLETLRLFLETADFSKLRRKSEKHLLAGKKVRFVIHAGNSQPEYEMKVT